jgi:hypothetical protein
MTHTAQAFLRLAHHFSARRYTFVALVVAYIIGLTPVDSRAGAVEVLPGNGTLQAAINAASEGTVAATATNPTEPAAARPSRDR